MIIRLLAPIMKLFGRYYHFGRWCKPGDSGIVNSSYLGQVIAKVDNKGRLYVCGSGKSDLINEKCIDIMLCKLESELTRAMKLHASMNSDHEAYAVILEELDEYWEQVRLKREKRSEEQICTELLQTAAMCLRAIHDLHANSIKDD